MVCHEGRDEIIGVVVALLHADGGGLADGLAGFSQQVRLELAFEEIVRRALFDEHVGHARAVLDQGASVVLAPV